MKVSADRAMAEWLAENANGTYPVRTLCSNCGHQGQMDIRRGTRRTEASIDCPKCDCRTLAMFPVVT